MPEANETYLGILGHNLRRPLGAIQTSTAFLLEADELPLQRGRTDAPPPPPNPRRGLGHARSAS